MPGPGWYSDPQDAAQVRWFDGDDWTEHRQPASPVSAATVSATAGGLAAGGVSYDPYADADDLTAPQPAASIGPPLLLPPSTLPAASPASEATDTTSEFGPRIESSAVSAASRSTPIPRAAHASGTRRPLDKRVLLIVAAVVVLLAALVTGGIALFGGGGSNSFTFQGKTIAGAAKTLQQAESNLSALVSTRHGAQNSSTRCYFAIPLDPAGAKKTDIDQYLRCGPVLFVDDDASRAYLSFAFTAAPSGSSIVLTPTATPQSNTPAAVPTGFVLKRPDGKAPSSDNGGLSAPIPPPAAANTLQATEVALPAGVKPPTATIGSYAGGLTITNIGKVTRFGTGDNARSAPAGQLLYAFKIAAAAGNDGAVKDLSSATTIALDNAAGRALPAHTGDQAIVIAVPTSVKSLDLVLNDSGLKQTFSLLTGKPGADNIVVLARTHRSDAVNQSTTTTYNYSAKVVFADGTTGTSQTATLSLAGVTLAYQDTAYSTTASAIDKAYLIPDIVYTGSHDGGPYGVNTSLLTFTPTGGAAAITAKNVSTDPTKLRNVFEVPAGVTTGTITVGGTATEMFAGSTTTYTLTVATPVSFAVSFPAG